MEYTIKTTKKVRLVAVANTWSNTISIEGDTIEEVVNLLMTEPTYLDKFIDLTVQLASIGNIGTVRSNDLDVKELNKPTFIIHGYEVGELPARSMQWESPISNFMYDVELKEDLKRIKSANFNVAEKFSSWDITNSTAVPLNVYFNKSIECSQEEMEKMIKEHSAYETYLSLVDDVINKKKQDANKHRVEQNAIKKQNDIYMLVNMMKYNKDSFDEMLNTAKGMLTEVPSTSIIDENGSISIV